MAHLVKPHTPLDRNGKEMQFAKAHVQKWGYIRTPLIRPPSESHWCGCIRGMVAREGFVYEQKPLSVTRNVVVREGWSLVRVVVRQGFYCTTRIDKVCVNVGMNCSKLPELCTNEDLEEFNPALRPALGRSSVMTREEHCKLHPVITVKCLSMVQICSSWDKGDCN